MKQRYGDVAHVGTKNGDVLLVKPADLPDVEGTFSYATCLSILGTQSLVLVCGTVFDSAV